MLTLRYLILWIKEKKPMNSSKDDTFKDFSCKNYNLWEKLNVTLKIYLAYYNFIIITEEAGLEVFVVAVVAMLALIWSRNGKIMRDCGPPGKLCPLLDAYCVDIWLWKKKIKKSLKYKCEY